MNAKDVVDEKRGRCGDAERMNSRQRDPSPYVVNGFNRSANEEGKKCMMDLCDMRDVFPCGVLNG